MHKKHTKLNHKEHRHNAASRRGHLKNRDADDSTLEVIKAPHNSRKELSKKLELGDHEDAAKFKSNKDKHKHKREESKSHDRHCKIMHEKNMNIQDLMSAKELVKHNEKKEKRDKERLNKIEKYLEGMNKVDSKKLLHTRPLSLDSSKALLSNKEKLIRREKTFHDKTSRDVSTNSHINILQDQQSPTIIKEKLHKLKKHKHKEYNKRGSSKEKNIKDNQQSVMYCEVELQSPFLQEKKKYNVECLFPETSKEKSSRKRSSSRDNSAFSQLESALTSQRDKTKHLRDTTTIPVKFSPRKSKLTIDPRSHKDPKSNVTLGPYRKYFAFDKTSQNETARQKKKKRRKGDGTTKVSQREKRGDSKEEHVKLENTKKKQEKTNPNSDQYKAKIDDDIKSYFFKIQSLIDKKLDFILGNNNNSKDNKSNSVENENDVFKTKSIKEKKEEFRDRSYSKRKKRGSERCKSFEEGKQEKSLDEEKKAKRSDEEKKAITESTQKYAEVPNVSLKRERYPSEDSRNYRRSRSPQQQKRSSSPMDKRRSDKDVRHQRHKSPYPEYSTHKISPDRLIKMLEHPSTFSVQSSTSLLKKKHAEVKRRSNDTQTNPQYNQKRDRSLGKRNASPNEDNLNIKDIEKTHRHEAYSKKMRKRMTETHSNSSLIKEKLIDVTKYEPHSEFNGNGHRHKRGRSSTRRIAIPGEDDFEERDLVKVSNKKLKKRMRQLMNLECKTVSIVGIPSQIRESTIFNETQTTTSLNVINPTEDMIEQKKKSKRFKLYYKYSIADNKCPHESDKSSEGKKSIVSDSYRVVSDPSDCNLEVCEEKEEISKNTKNESESDLAKILFIMKNEKSHRNCGDVSKKIRKRGDSPKPITLNNIVEEPSNISIVIRANENLSPLKKDLNCTFFKTLKSSSSGCNLEPIRKSIQGNPNKHKNCNPLKDNSIIPKSSPKKVSERSRENKKLKYEEKRGYNKKVKKMESHHRIKKKYREMNNYTSKSDINISYDSLTEHKFKGKYKPNGPSHFREQLRQLLPDIFFRKSSPERKSIDIIIKEGIKEIIREIPKNVIREISFAEESNQTNKSINISDKQEKNSREPDSKEPIETSKNHDVAEKTYCTKKIKDIHEVDSNENIKIQDVEQAAYSSKKIMADDNPKIQNAEEKTNYSEKATDSQETDSKLPTDCPKVQDVEEKSYCSKKIGTCNTMSKIPSLIKGYTGTTASQIIKDESIKAHNSTDQVYVDDVTGNRKELGEKNLVDAATEVIITEEVADKAVIMLENKKSQTPSYLDTPTVVTICDPTKHYKYSKKIATMNNVKRCQITDSFGEPNMGSVCKPARPIINLENEQFPSRKLPEPERCSTPMSGQCQRLEEKTVSFENQEKFQPRKLLERRPATADERRTPPSKPSLDEFRDKPTKRALTMSTNVVTIEGSICTESSGIYNTYADYTRNDTKDNSVQEKTLDRHAVTTLKKNQESLFSKSSMSLNDVDMESRIGSLVCVDRYSNAQKINFSSNSNSRSLDRYTEKSLISDQPHASRLFLTKSFDPKMNTYQRRKMYDESIRKKMKKKFGTQNQMGPRIFEVRYLTLENPNLDEGFDNKTSPTPIVNQKCISRLPTYNTKTNKAKLRTKTSKISTKKPRKISPKNKEDACKFSGRDIFAPVISDVDQLNKFRRKSFPEKKVEEIFVKKSSHERNLSDKELNSSYLKNGVINEEQICKMSKIDSENTHQNFKDLIDQLYNSIVSYCDTKFKSPQEPSLDPTQIDKDRQIIPRSPPANEKSYVIFPKHSNETTSTLNNPYKKNSCSEGNVAGEEKESKRPTNLIFSHLSCPVLAGSTSSFDYLYEDGPIEINKDAVLLHFKKPMKTILGYALNNPSRIQRETFRQFLKKEYQTPNSVTESEESGYSSSNSKKCTSVSSFFKKPSIANLFKPVKKLETSLQSTSSLNDSRSGPNLQEYNVMNQKCIEYAEKVRNQTKNKDESEETFQEIPLDVLLFCRKSSALLSDFNSNCSLCKKHSNSDLPDITEADELSNNSENRENLLEIENIIKEDILLKEVKSADTLNEDNVHEETLVFYKEHEPSLEITTLQRSRTSFGIDDTSQLTKDIVQYPVVLSITNLNSCSLTVVEEQSSSNNNLCLKGKQKESVKRIESDAVYSDHINVKDNCHISKSDLKSSTQMDVDGKSDISSSFGSRYSNSPSVTSKFMAKRFFDNLLKVYEKEIDVTNKLFQDDDFFLNVLLESVKSEEVPKPKNIKLKKLIKGRIKNCIGNMFGPKNCMDKPRASADALTCNFNNKHQGKLQILAGDARKYFSMFVQAVKTNKDINDEIKICGLLRLLERIEDGDFAILRKKEEVDFEEEIKEQVKEAFVSIYRMSVKEARKRRRSLTTDDLKLIRTFVSKYRIGLLSKTDLIATYIGRGVFRTEGHLKAAVTYLIQQNKTKDIDLKDFDEHCKILAKY